MPSTCNFRDCSDYGAFGKLRSCTGTQIDPARYNIHRGMGKYIVEDSRLANRTAVRHPKRPNHNRHMALFTKRNQIRYAGSFSSKRVPVPMWSNCRYVKGRWLLKMNCSAISPFLSSTLASATENAIRMREMRSNVRCIKTRPPATEEGAQRRASLAKSDNYTKLEQFSCVAVSIDMGSDCVRRSVPLPVLCG
jgi:hypothetical protein